MEDDARAMVLGPGVGWCVPPDSLFSFSFGISFLDPPPAPARLPGLNFVSTTFLRTRRVSSNPPHLTLAALRVLLPRTPIVTSHHMNMSMHVDVFGYALRSPSLVFALATCLADSILTVPAP
jgi:hypothetical protein